MCKRFKMLLVGFVVVACGVCLQAIGADAGAGKAVVVEKAPVIENVTKAASPAPEAPKIESPKVEAPKAEEPKAEEPKAEPEQAPASAEAAPAPVEQKTESEQNAESKSEAPVAQADKPEKKVDELVGIDTVNVDEPSGNWLYKRLFWERAEDKYQKLKELVDAIMEARTKFFKGRVKLDKEIFDPIYTRTNYRGGELSSILKDMLEELQKMRERKHGLDEAERDLFAKIEMNKERLEEFQAEIQFLLKIDAAVDEAIDTLVSLINQARNFENQGWADFKAISRELSDKKARDLFYRIDTYWRNVKDIQVYVTTKLDEHMTYLEKTAKQHAEKVNLLLNDLEKQGFILKEQVEALDKKKEVSPEEEEAAALKAKAASGGFFNTVGRIFSWMAQPFVAIAKALWHTVTYPYRYFFGEKKATALEAVPTPPEVAKEGEEQQKQPLPEAP